MAIDVERLQMTSVRLSDVVADPTQWTRLLDDIANAAGTMGCGLVAHGVPARSLASSALEDCLDTYLREGWFETDRYSRKRALELQSRGEVAIDRDLVAPAERHSPFLDEFLPRFGGKWWAGVGFSSGPQFWSLVLHRSASQEPFGEHEKSVLRGFSRRLGEICSLSYLVGTTTLSEVADSFDRLGKAVVAIDAGGTVVRVNAAAERMFDDDVRVAGRRLVLGDRGAAAEYRKILERLRGAASGKALRANPVIVPRAHGPPLLVKVLPVDGAARSPFIHARALVLIEKVGKQACPDQHLLAAAFGFTPAEARLAGRVATGESLESIRHALQITKETARSQLKSIFQKADVHRQAELVALLNSVLRSA